jgi:acetyl/propionyl-CoA carboxylase alpha subunit
MAQKLALTLDGVQAEAEVIAGADGLRVRLGERWHSVDFVPTGRIGLYSLLVDGRSFEVYAEARTGGWEILIGTRVFSVDAGPARPAGRGPVAMEPAGTWLLRSPLAGIVVETLVAPGDAVRAGQVLLVIESMKMNNELTAARGGTVTEVHVRPGERVERGVQLVRIE